MAKESVNGQWHSTLYIYVCIYSLFLLNMKAGVFKHFGVVLLQSIKNIKVLLNSPNKKFVLSRSFLTFFRIFCKLKEQFLRVWENFAPTPGVQPSFFASGQGIRQKKLPGWPGFACLKKFSRGLPGGGGNVPSWN